MLQLPRTGLSQAREVYNHVEDLEIGTMIPISTLRDLVGGGNPYGAISRASRWLQRDHQRFLDCVRGQGYQVAGGMRQLDKAKSMQKSAARASRKGLVLVKTTDRQLLNAEERTYRDRMLIVMGHVVATLYAHDQTLIRHSAAIRALGETQHKDRRATEEQVAELRDRLRTLEASVGIA